MMILYIPLFFLVRVTIPFCMPTRLTSGEVPLSNPTANLQILRWWSMRQERSWSIWMPNPKVLPHCKSGKFRSFACRLASPPWLRMAAQWNQQISPVCVRRRTKKLHKDCWKMRKTVTKKRVRQLAGNSFFCFCWKVTLFSHQKYGNATGIILYLKVGSGGIQTSVWFFGGLRAVIGDLHFWNLMGFLYNKRGIV